MSNFLTDNEDLRFYVETGIDWADRMEQVEVFRHKDAPANGDEAKEFYQDILNLVGAFAADEIAPHSHELDEAPLILKDGEVHFPERLQGIFDQLKEMEIHGMCLRLSIGAHNCMYFSFFYIKG